MPKGGSKPGERRGGRKAGTANKAKALVAAGQLTMIDIMANSARKAYEQVIPAIERLIERLGPEQGAVAQALLREVRAWQNDSVQWAKAAAPFMHPTLSAIAHKHINPDGSSIRPVVNVYIREESGATRPARIGSRPMAETGPSPGDTSN